MIALDTLKLVLSVIIILMCIIPLNATITKHYNIIILALLFITLLSLLFNDVAFTFLLICASVVFIYNVSNKKKIDLKIREKMYQQPLKISSESKEELNHSSRKEKQKDKKKLPPIPPDQPSVPPSNTVPSETNKQDKSQITNASNTLKRHFSDMDKRLDKMQSNVFDKINYGLFYNEMGEQHNIQGIETDISGFDTNMFMNG